MNWFKSTLASVAGTQEPVYGPEAFHPVTSQTETVPYTVLSKEDLKWRAMEHTCVETQTFYFTTEAGEQGWIQIIYSNVVGMHMACHVNTKIFSNDPNKPHHWVSDPVENWLFDESMYAIGGDNLLVALNDQGDTFTLKSAVNPDCLVDVTFTRTAPGFKAGQDGTSLFGNDLRHPWGSMLHGFWPRCVIEGKITTPEREVPLTGRGFFVHALQGMKPHHAASTWNFCNFQSPSYSAITMEFSTPPSYGSVTVNVGGIAKDGEIICAGSRNKTTHLGSSQDSDNDWPEPTGIKFDWAGTTPHGQPLEASLEGSLGKRLDRVDVMAEIPGFIKSIIGSVAGTKPYIYQYSPSEKVPLKLRIGDSETAESGVLYTESTFIS